MCTPSDAQRQAVPSKRRQLWLVVLETSTHNFETHTLIALIFSIFVTTAKPANQKDSIKTYSTNWLYHPKMCLKPGAG